MRVPDGRHERAQTLRLIWMAITTNEEVRQRGSLTGTQNQVQSRRARHPPSLPHLSDVAWVGEAIYYAEVWYAYLERRRTVVHLLAGNDCLQALRLAEGANFPSPEG